jgi:hypothetical protein
MLLWLVWVWVWAGGVFDRVAAVFCFSSSFVGEDARRFSRYVEKLVLHAIHGATAA